MKIILPDIGPTRLSVWLADIGEEVYEGDRLVEVLMYGATFDVLSPTNGRLVEKLALIDDDLIPGQTLGLIESHTSTQDA